MTAYRVQERKPAELDYKLVFDLMPGMCMVLDPAFNIVAQNAEHALATLTVGKPVIGKNLFDVYPENPDDEYSSAGIAELRDSLVRVLKTRAPDVMPIVRYDVKPLIGDYEVRYWAAINAPIIGPDGFVQWIINRADDVTHLVEQTRRETH